MIDKKIVKLKSTFATISESFTGNKPFWVRNRLLWNTANPYLYIRTTSDNRIIVGGRDENFYSPRRRDPLIPLKTRQLKADLRGLFPHLEFIPEFSWTGTFGTTPDGLPYIGSYRKLSNSYFALGFGGNGVTFSLVASEMIADLIEGKKNSDLDLFSFNRIQAAP
jgi:glycine/D-amino acid oxidase-like deaminating enzyme